MNTPKKPEEYTNMIMSRGVSAEEAEEMGAFEEEALSYEDAIMSIEDDEEWNDEPS